METKPKAKILNENHVTVEEVNRLLEIGSSLFSVLTPEEIEKLQKLFSTQKEICNTGGSWRPMSKELRFLFTEKETNLGGLLITGKISEEAYDYFRSEQQEKSINLRIIIDGWNLMPVNT